MAKPHIPDAMATAEPLDEPPGTRNTLASQGLRGVPRTRLVPAPPRGEFHRLGLAKDDAAGPLEGFDEASLGSDEVRHVHVGAGRHGHAVDRQQVLDRHRHPHERTQVGARRQQPVEGARLGHGLVGGDELKGA